MRPLALQKRGPGEIRGTARRNTREYPTRSVHSPNWKCLRTGGTDPLVSGAGAGPRGPGAGAAGGACVRCATRVGEMRDPDR